MTESTRGTFTFLFTDIEGSTRLWEDHPRLMVEVLSRHDSIFLEAVSAHSGSVFSHTGDGICAAFTNASDAVTAALQAQLHLARENWGEVGSIRVRMGVHTGEAEERQGNYFGSTLNHASRIMSAGHGGQVLLSGVAQEMARERLPDNASLADLGEHRLRDLSRPEHLFRLAHPDLREELRPIRSLDAAPRNLPVQPTPFIGREKELSEVMGLLNDPSCRLLTLAGPGGIGKTRLGIEAARRSIGSYHDGVYFVSLQPVTSVEFLISSIADSLSLSLQGQEELKVQLLDHLMGRHQLLVLDNFEHLLPAVDLLSEMVSVAPKVKLLVTSRESLNLREEWICPIDGMSYPDNTEVNNLGEYDAVRLFIDHARKISRDFSPEEESHHIVRICRAIEGMPLGIELAASWLRHLSCEEIAGEIERNLDFLESGLRNVPQRHRSMRAVFDESWNLLEPEERDVFMRLSGFPGSFDREAAKRISSASLSVLTLLADKSLVKVTLNRRYQIHELLRQYAYGRLAESPEQVTEVHDLHCAYYMDFLHERLADISGYGQVTASNEIEAELENLRAAWQWAIDQGKSKGLRQGSQTYSQFFQFRSRYLEAATAFEKASDSLIDGAKTPESRRALATIQVWQAWFYIRLGRLDEAEEVLRNSHEIYSSNEFRPEWGFATDPLSAMGVIATIRGNYTEAAKLGEKALEASKAQNNSGNSQIAYYVLSRAAFLLGDYESASKHAEQAYAITVENQDRWFAAYCLIELGRVASALGDYAGATKHYIASYEMRKEFQDPQGMAMALASHGDAELLQGSYTEARDLFQQAMTMYQDTNDKGGLGWVHSGLARAATELGDYSGAEDHFQKALNLGVDLNFLPFILSVVTGVGAMSLRKSHLEQGIELVTFALNHPGSDHETRSWARRILDQFEAEQHIDPMGHAGHTTSVEQALKTLGTSLRTPSNPQLRPLLENSVLLGQTRPQVANAAQYPDGLTKREVEVLHLIATGKSNREIAEELFITVNTAANHVKNILSKTSASNRTEAAAYARDQNLL